MAKINTKEAVLPAPVKWVDGVDVKTLTMKQWFTKINEELDEFKEVVLRWSDLDYVGFNSGFVEKSDENAIADEAADVVTAITSMLEAVGIDERQRQAAQMRVNDKNRRRGRLE